MRLAHDDNLTTSLGTSDSLDESKKLHWAEQHRNWILFLQHANRLNAKNKQKDRTAEPQNQCFLVQLWRYMYMALYHI